jgi:hypothetical protein
VSIAGIVYRARWEVGGGGQAQAALMTSVFGVRLLSE